MFLFLFFCVCFGNNITISIFSGQPIDSSYKTLIINSYINYVYSLTSTDFVQLLINGNQIIDWTQINNWNECMKKLDQISLQTLNIPVVGCISNYYLDAIPSDSILYIIMNKNPCTSQAAAVTALKERGVFIFSVGFGQDVSDETLTTFANGTVANVDYVHY